jgi:hypothetical protein
MEQFDNSTPDSYRGDNGKIEECKNGMMEHEKIQIKTTDCKLLTANNCSLATAHQLSYCRPATANC